MHLREDRRELSGRVEIDDAYLGGELSRGKAGRGSENKVPFVAAVRTTPSGQPVLACPRQQPHTEEEIAVFAARHIAPSATVVSDGLWCFGATTIVDAAHGRYVTGGGKASVKLPQFKPVSTLLGNLQTAISGSYHAFDFAKYAHRYPAFVPTSLLTRAEVLANLEAWQLAGVPGLARGDADTDLNNAEYWVAQAKYELMIDSPEFAQRAIRIARQRGERVDIAGK